MCMIERCMSGIHLHLCIILLWNGIVNRSCFSSDKQSSWKNDKESGQGIASSSSSLINPAAAWVGQFPSFHHRALLPYASSTVGHNQSQHLFHSASGYRLVQDPRTGQFFFIPGFNLLSFTTCKREIIKIIFSTVDTIQQIFVSATWYISGAFY